MRRLATVVAACMLLGACGLPDDDEPRVLDADDIAQLTPKTVPPAEADEESGVEVDVYLMNNVSNHLEARMRRVESRSIDDVVNALLEGPGPDDPRRVDSPIPSTTILREATFDDSLGVATIDLGADPPESGIFSSIQGEALVKAFAEIVWTVTTLPDVRAVQFRNEGVDVDVPTSEGPSKRVVSREDYADLAAPGE